jgi:hypothetical protein
VFLLNVVVYHRPTDAGPRNYIIGFVDPLEKPDFMLTAEEEKDPMARLTAGVHEWQIQEYLNGLPEAEVQDRIIQIYGRMNVGLSWALLLFLYVFVFDSFSTAFAQLALREYLKRKETQIS